MDMGVLTFGEATEEDLETVVYMLSDDSLGSTRERYAHLLPDSYLKAFHAIKSDPNSL